MRLPTNETINRRFFKESNPLFEMGSKFKKKWYTGPEGILAFGAEDNNWKFDGIVMPWYRKFVPFVWPKSGGPWVRVGGCMTLEEAKAVCLMHIAMRKIAPPVEVPEEE